MTTTTTTTTTAETERITTETRASWRALAQQLRVDSVEMADEAQSGHPTSSMSAAELMAVLLAKYFRYDVDDPHAPDNDHLVFSKGHASPLFYAMLRAEGAIAKEELHTYRKRGSRLEGHPTPVLPFVDVATGSLGQGLPIGVGMALAGRRLERASGFHVWVLCGDSEMAEGSMWEAFEHAAFNNLDNLTAVVDVNGLGQTGSTMVGFDLEIFVKRAEAFGWHAIAIDGHDVADIDAAYAAAVDMRDRPTAIFARTEKGHGVAEVAGKNGFHGKPLPHAAEAVAELGGERNMHVDVAVPRWRSRPAALDKPVLQEASVRLPSFATGGDKVATRMAYGDALVALGVAREDVVVLDGEVSNSTYAEKFAHMFADRYFEMYIAEQQMIAAAVGMQVRGYKPFASTFAAFLTRAHDFIRMAAVSRAHMTICGSHAGVSIGEDGPSQMGLEDLAMMRAIHGSTVLYPCDANQCAILVAGLVEREGISYVRTTREKTPILYAASDAFPIGGSRVVRGGGADDVVTIVAAGITVHEAIEAADTLLREGVTARVIDAYSVKPIDVAALTAAAAATSCFVTVEDHRPEGGLGDAVLDALAAHAPRIPRLTKLAVRTMPASATPDEQLHDAGIDAEAIASAARAAVLHAHRAGAHAGADGDERRVVSRR